MAQRNEPRTSDESVNDSELMDQVLQEQNLSISSDDDISSCIDGITAVSPPIEPINVLIYTP